jgi:hypothetical protein
MGETQESQLLLVRIETKLDLALRQQEDHEYRLRILESHGTASHGDRLSMLERWRYALPTAAVLSLASMVSVVVTTVWK